MRIRVPSVRKPTREEILSHLDNWRWWMTGAYFAGVVILVFVIVLFARTAREEARQASAARVSANNQVVSCFNAVQNAPTYAGIVFSLKTNIDNSLISTEQSLAATGKHDPLRPVRLRARKRLLLAEKGVRDFRNALRAQTPKKKHCVALARKLHIASSPFLKKRGHK